jgi:chemotaxis methyl-accepting protein methylase
VTTFFRDRDVFESLKAHVIPQLFDVKQPNEAM